MKSKRSEIILKKIKRFLKLDGNLMVLAARMNYSHPQSIKNWIDRKSVPALVAQRAEETLNELIKKRK